MPALINDLPVRNSAGAAVGGVGFLGSANRGAFYGKEAADKRRHCQQ
jgi:hypothetical protein